jgi:hypothetical protein
VKKKLAAIAGLVALMSLGSSVAFAWVAGQPNIQTVSATFDLKSQGPLSGKSCKGPGPAKDLYETFTHTWKGAQTDTSIGPHPRSLTGTVTETSTTVIDLNTGHAIVTGTTQLVDGTNALVYKGNFILNVQLQGDGTSIERGGVNLAFYSGNNPTGGFLIGNTEKHVSSTVASPPLEVTGFMGDDGTAATTPTVPDITAELNEPMCS